MTILTTLIGTVAFALIAPVGVAFNTLIMAAAFVVAIIAGPMGF